MPKSVWPGPGFDESGTMMKDDWFVFYFDHDHSRCHRANPLAQCDPVRYSVHELCSRFSCSDPNFRECPHHPEGCGCSLGQCQL